MKRTMVGDVYALKTERGYRILQWAYFIEKEGKFVRVFPNFYQEIPTNIDQIVSGECSYMLHFDISKMYRKGILELIYRAPVETIPSFPKYTIDYDGETFEICEFEYPQNSKYYDAGPDINELPRKYRKLKLVHPTFIDPCLFIYVVSSDFDLHNWDLFNPDKPTLRALYIKYGKILFGEKFSLEDTDT